VRSGLILLMLIAVPCWGQTTPTGKAETSGFCSPAVSGSNNQFTITCQNIPDKLRGQLVDLLNRVAKNQADAETILSKLDGCLEGIKQVRQQAAPWNMTADQKRELKRLLKGSKTKFAVHVIPTDRNASLYGVDLISALRDSGWDLVGGGLNSDFTLNPGLVGVVLVVSHKDFPEAALLQAALHNALGIEIAGEIDAGKKLAMEDDVIYIAIGAKPPVQ
jgi:hypothetical protein